MYDPCLDSVIIHPLAGRNICLSVIFQQQEAAFLLMSLQVVRLVRWESVLGFDEFNKCIN